MASSSSQMLSVPLVPLGSASARDLQEAEEGSASSRIDAPLLPWKGSRSAIGRAFLTWVFPLMRRSQNVEKLVPADLFSLEAIADPDALTSEFIAEWQQAQRRQQQRPRGQDRRGDGRQLLWVLLRVHIPRVRLLWLCRAFQALMAFAFPLSLQLLVKFAEDTEQPWWKGFLLATGMFVLQASVVLLNGSVTIGLSSMSLRIVGSLTAAIFRKVTVLRQDSLASFGAGRLNNLITTDVDSARMMVRYVHNLIFNFPTKLVLSLTYLYLLVGPGVFAGMAWLAIIAAINPIIMYYAGKLEERQQKRTDERVFKVREALSAIHTIKCYGWEEPATKMIDAARKAEIQAIWRLYLLYILMEAMWNSILPVTTLIMFGAYSFLNPDKPLEPAVAFTAITLLDVLNATIFDLPWVINLVVTAVIASKRIERLFILPENEQGREWAAFCPQTPGDDGSGAAAPAVAGDDDTDADAKAKRELAAKGSIEMADATFKWLPAVPEPGEEGETEGNADATPSADFQLRNISLSIPNGALVAVVGPTASGKTSLLHAILGEMQLVVGDSDSSPDAAAADSTAEDGSGTTPASVADDAAKAAPAKSKPSMGTLKVDRRKGIAFAPQQPWIFNASVYDNILFGEKHVESHYNACIYSCGLTEDLSILSAGDQTKVGEKGTNMSGGQKARVGLARAAYRKESSRIFLLDDPYSALDAHVARHVHKEVVQVLLAKRTRVVTMNRLEFLSSCDLAIVLDNGSIEALGTPEEVRRRSPVLRRLLRAQGLLSAEEEHEAAEQDGDDKDAMSLPSGKVGLRRSLSGGSAHSAEESHQKAAAEQEGQPSDKAENLAASVAGDEEEGYESGNVSKEVVLFYLRHMGSAPVIFLLAAVYGISELLSLLSPFWLSVWTDARPVGNKMFFYLYIYTALNSSMAVLMALRDMFANLLGFRAATRLHAGMFAALLRRPMSFFQDTPSGRIINRFSKDTSEIDKDIVWNVAYSIVPVLSMIGSICLVTWRAWGVIVCFVPMGLLLFMMWRYYNKAVLDVKRISKVLSSPVYDHFNNLCRENGISLVRAHHQVLRHFDINAALLREQFRPKYTMIYLQNWFSMRMEHLGSLFVYFVALFVVFGRERFISASQAGLVLTLAGDVSDTLENVMSQISELGMSLNCVERVKEYSSPSPVEAPALTDTHPPEDWPNTGHLTIENLKLRYKPALPLVLKGISVEVPAGERLGIVGRTGAGKSSLLLALFRIVEPEQGTRIVLDGMDVLAMGLQDLRQRLAMIPQEPVLFQADMKYNCDPFGNHDTERVWQALEEAQLAPWLREQWTQRRGNDPQTVDDVEAIKQCLQFEVKENGQNLSSGQRQMVAIARAVLRHSKLIVLDEATAALDSSTDAAIQLAIRRCFKGATTLTIAHRIKTILDSDRIMVLANGDIVELDTPDVLQSNPEGLFAQLSKEIDKGDGGRS